MFYIRMFYRRVFYMKALCRMAVCTTAFYVRVCGGQKAQVLRLRDLPAGDDEAGDGPDGGLRGRDDGRDDGPGGRHVGHVQRKSARVFLMICSPYQRCF